MQNFKTNKIEEWYILQPQNVVGSITTTSKGLYFSDNLTIETFDNKTDWENRCEELNIELETEENIK